MSYFSSINYFDQQSTVKGANFKRLAASSRVSYQATDRLKISTDIQMSYGKTNTLSEGGAMANPILAQYFNRPTDPLRNPDGSWYLGQSGRLSNGKFNVAALQDLNYTRNETARVFANLQAEYKIIKGLTYKFVLHRNLLIFLKMLITHHYMEMDMLIKEERLIYLQDILVLTCKTC